MEFIWSGFCYQTAPDWYYRNRDGPLRIYALGELLGDVFSVRLFAIGALMGGWVVSIEAVKQLLFCADFARKKKSVLLERIWLPRESYRKSYPLSAKLFYERCWVYKLAIIFAYLVNIFVSWRRCRGKGILLWIAPLNYSSCFEWNCVTVSPPPHC